MPPLVSTTLLLGAAYLVGAIPFGLLVGLLRGVDVRRVGSGNIGATNVSRTLGRKWGILVFLLDFAKGLVPVALALSVARAHPEALSLAREGWLGIAAGVAALLGHVFPVYLCFRGGKGVATTFGVVTGLSWPAALAAGLVWLALFASARIVSVASLGAALALPIAVSTIDRARLGVAHGPVLVVAIGAAVLIFARHHANIRRLLRGEEHRWRRG